MARKAMNAITKPPTLKKQKVAQAATKALLTHKRAPVLRSIHPRTKEADIWSTVDCVKYNDVKVHVWVQHGKLQYVC